MGVLKRGEQAREYKVGLVGNRVGLGGVGGGLILEMASQGEAPYS